MSSSDSESEDDEVGERSGVEVGVGVEFQKNRGLCKDFFLSMAGKRIGSSEVHPRIPALKIVGDMAFN